MRPTSPLFVDLDHTLVKVDCLFESVGLLFRRKPLKIFKLILLILQGRKTHLKHWLDSEVSIEVESLPYNKEVLNLIEKKRASGGKVFLATASNQNVADAVAHHLDCFDGVMASNQEVNLKGENKLTAIHGMVEKLEAEGFEYVGDNKADMPIFAKSKRGYLVAKSKKFATKACEELKQLEVLEEDWNRVKPYLKQLRPHQWAKNFLLFVPLIMTRNISDMYGWISLMIAFIAFSLSASSVYFLNDWVDVNKDRKHPSKWKRPLASGGIPLAVAPLGFMILALSSVSFSWIFLGMSFTAVLVTYLISNILYSFWLKSKAILDVIVLTMMYVFRVYAGGVAAGVEVSNWLLSVCLFFFLSLAMAKRFSELLNAEKLGKPLDHRIRGYAISDIDVMKTIGIASAIAAIAVVTIYIQEMDLPDSTGSPRMLWLLCPLILYWLARFWMITFRGDLDEDPIIFALKDKVSYGICACLIAILFAGELPFFSWVL